MFQAPLVLARPERAFGPVSPDNRYAYIADEVSAHLVILWRGMTLRPCNWCAAQALFPGKITPGFGGQNVERC